MVGPTGHLSLLAVARQDAHRWTALGPDVLTVLLTLLRSLLAVDVSALPHVRITVLTTELLHRLASTGLRFMAHVNTQTGIGTHDRSHGPL